MDRGRELQSRWRLPSWHGTDRHIRGNADGRRCPGSSVAAAACEPPSPCTPRQPVRQDSASCARPAAAPALANGQLSAPRRNLARDLTAAPPARRGVLLEGTVTTAKSGLSVVDLWISDGKNLAAVLTKDAVLRVGDGAGT